MVAVRAAPYVIPLGASTTLTVNVVSGGLEPYSYLWSTGQTAVSIVVSPTQTTTYTVQVTDLVGQTNTASVIITISEPPEPPTVEVEQPAPTVPAEPPAETSEPPADETDVPADDLGGDDSAQTTPTTALSGLCPVFGLSSIGLTLLGLLWTRGARSRKY